MESAPSNGPSPSFVDRTRLPEWIAGLLGAAWAVGFMLEQGRVLALALGGIQAMVWTYLLVVPHELGHALGARAVGAEVREIVLGSGPRLLAFDWGTTRVRIHLGLAGHSYVDDVLTERAHYRLRSFLVVAAGPATNLGLATLAWFAGGRTLWPETGSGAWQAFLVANLGMALFSLWPWHLVEGDELYPSDGMQLLSIPRISDPEIDMEVEAALEADTREL